MIRFDVTYEIMTEKSAENGNYAEIGFISQHVRLRDAIADVRATRTNRYGSVISIEPSESGRSFRWITIDNVSEFETGAQESRSIHFPERLTDSSRVRIARLLNCRLI